MKKNFYPEVRIQYDASGAAQAAAAGDIVVIVDIIDMSTTLETCLEEGAVSVYGASPISSRAPVELNPLKVASRAAENALHINSSVVIISEPRIGTMEEREKRCTHIIDFLRSKEIVVTDIIPNLGKEVAKLADFRGKIVIAVTDSGGVAFDAAFNINEQVYTATVARTYRSKGIVPARKGAIRALQRSKINKANITLVAASSNSVEDILAAQYIKDILISFS